MLVLGVDVGVKTVDLSPRVYQLFGLDRVHASLLCSKGVLISSNDWPAPFTLHWKKTPGNIEELGEPIINLIAYLSFLLVACLFSRVLRSCLLAIFANTCSHVCSLYGLRSLSKTIR